MASVLAAIGALADPILRDKARRSVAAVRSALSIFGPPALAFSFNGGKDSTVILHLLRAAVVADQDAAGGGEEEPPLSASGVRTFIFDRPAADFPEVRAFVAECDRAWGLGLDTLTLPEGGGGGEKGAAAPGTMATLLGDYLTSRGVRAVLLGTRRGDPNAGGQAEWCPSSPGWPPFMRVNPILGWGYADVWAFLDALAVPYCSLYDAGFTSLGSVAGTAPNAALARPDGSWAPARELADGREERAGRVVVKGGGGGGAGAAAAARPPSASTRIAAVLIIGDELLAARVPDANGAFLCGRLRACGWRVARVVTLPDEVGAIAAEVASAAASHAAVLIAGGVGPTEDDVTLEAVASAFGVPLARDPDLESRLRSYFGSGRADGGGPPAISEAHLKMADAPEGVEAVEVGEGDRPSPFPLLAFRNCFILPGVPGLLRAKWPALEAALGYRFGACAPFVATSLRLVLGDELAAAPALASAVAAVGGRARVGSYPLDPPAPEDGATLVVVVEGKDGAAVEAGVAAAVGALPSGCVLSTDVSGAV